LALAYPEAVQALLKDGPLKGKPVEVDPVAGRPPMTVDVPGGNGDTYRYCLEELDKEGMTAAYTFLYAV
jgi:hypothetical protein